MSNVFSFVQVPERDALDVHIKHRALVDERNRQPGEQRDARNRYPPELIRR